jgi:hypothetical protein
MQPIPTSLNGKKRGIPQGSSERGKKPTARLLAAPVIRVDSREQAEEMRNKDIEDRKEQGGNIYSFELVFGPAKGEETSKPKLIYRNKEQPNYEGAKGSKPGER